MSESTLAMMTVNSDFDYSVNSEDDYSAYYEDNIEYQSPCDSGDIIDFSRVFIITLYSLVTILGFIGNVLVVCVLVKHRNQTSLTDINQTSLTDICLFNLALSDLLFVVTLPLYTHYTMVKTWTSGNFLCHLSGGLHSTGFFCSIFFMVVMTLDRYMVILHDAKVVQYRTVKTGYTLTVVVWFLSLCISLPSFIFTTEIQQSNGLGCSYVPNNNAWKVYGISSINILGLVLPLLVMVLCYSRILPVLMRIKSTKKQRVVKLIISIVVTFFLLWAPYNISLFLRYLQTQERFPKDCDSLKHLKLSIAVTETIAYTHCCLNPIIYAFVGQRFMRRVFLLGKCMSVSRHSSDYYSRKSLSISRSSERTSIL
ncbi:CX3C chemokine receptor 1 [Corythoichthys intestinalis]|uniref:CX3C chemokine receptor 1 n=1 Tax=Corythoichthys intestinalis TaxID=161448 RepID=UPI0025A62DA5|nr:CX3C chemokine receptor 1 [Corythoichthys intestinalis]